MATMWWSILMMKFIFSMFLVMTMNYLIKNKKMLKKNLNNKMKMMMNVFSTFDPCTGKLSMNWLSTLMFIFIIPNKFWKKQHLQKHITTFFK